MGGLRAMTTPADMQDVRDDTQRRSLRDALESMAWQFAYRSRALRDGRRLLTTGGLSALEEAFAALGWPDPYEPPESQGCEVCGDWATGTSGGRWYCGEHMPP